MKFNFILSASKTSSEDLPLSSRPSFSWSNVGNRDRVIYDFVIKTQIPDCSAHLP